MITQTIKKASDECLWLFAAKLSASKTQKYGTKLPH